MTEKNEKQALLDELDWCIENGMSGPRSKEALASARFALAQQPQCEASAWYDRETERIELLGTGEFPPAGDTVVPLYETPQAAPVAQGLTDEEVYGVLRSYGVDRKDSDNIAHDLRLAQAAPSASKDASAPVFPPYSGTELKAAMCFETPPCAGVAKPIIGKEQA